MLTDLPADGGEDGAAHWVGDDRAEGTANVGEAHEGRLLLLRNPHGDHVVQGGEGKRLEDSLNIMDEHIRIGSIE